jgi:hypothetical protein
MADDENDQPGILGRALDEAVGGHDDDEEERTPPEEPSTQELNG